MRINHQQQHNTHHNINHHPQQHQQQHSKHSLAASESQITHPVESVQGYVLFINNIDRNIDAETLTDTLSDFGQVISLHYELSRRTGLPIGLALVKYANLDQAREALEGLRGKRLGSKVLQCDWCFKHPPQVSEENQEEEKSTIIESTNLSNEEQDHSEDKRKREDQQQLTTDNTEPPLKKTFEDAEEWIEEERFLLELQQAGYKGGPNPPIIDKEDAERITKEFKEKFPDEVIKTEDEIKEKLEKIEKKKQERLEGRKKPEETEKETKVSFEIKEETQAEEEPQYGDNNYQQDAPEEEEEEEEEEYVRKYDPNRDSDDEYY
ncbi:predicted protein [Naegleria gruberi]|uniref:Predicted protein n=1 Tax=Naegleria gruberi TaxID=5762 RepID=D2VQ62_NAEGR|nr:uncharacterized protein NAEGRDRAFT_51342 [Naegleria gruberi]EFC41052.1 predicted protein [Naegleria gruberi]|eukprot:XP_002673796.1 predicted protein [Naegleria gruberi strain NEG-M]